MHEAFLRIFHIHWKVESDEELGEQWQRYLLVGMPKSNLDPNPNKWIGFKIHIHFN